MPFKFEKCAIEEVVKISSLTFSDNRGLFYEAFKMSEFQTNGINIGAPLQMNCSISEKNVLRGLHYQLEPYAQGKLVKVVSGKIFDVAVDLRQGSPTFRKWVGLDLDAEKNEMLWIPPGFAHGFLTLSSKAEICYVISGAEYEPDSEAGIIWNDTELAINWPVETPTLSDKDRLNPLFKNAEMNFTYGKNR